MIRQIINDSIRKYDLNIASYLPISSKSFRLKCKEGSHYFLKKTNLFAQDKYNFLFSQGIDNVLYPLKNRNGEFVSNGHNNPFYVMQYLNNDSIIDEIKAVNLSDELIDLHYKTYFKRQLSVSFSRTKMEEIYEYLQYKFAVLELFVRTIESRPFDEYSITILKNYQYILDAKKIMGRLHKKLISDIKDKKSVYYSFVHNNPKVNHLLYLNGDHFLTSIENAKVGISSLDMAKFYIETEDLNIDSKEIIKTYLDKYEDNFYFDYFCFLVLLYYIKGIVIIDKDYVSSQSFIYTSGAIKRFIRIFGLKEDKT